MSDVCVVSSHKAVSPAHGDGSVSDFGLRMERPGPESESEEDVTSDQGGGHTNYTHTYNQRVEHNSTMKTDSLILLSPIQV